jgi:hypothetical protein
MSLFRDGENLERRRAPRHPPHSASCCRIVEPHSGRSWPAAIQDISLTGIALLSDHSFEAGQMLTLELRNAQRGFECKNLIEVRHADIRCPNDACLHGCRFARPLREEELRMLL